MLSIELTWFLLGVGCAFAIEAIIVPTFYFDEFMDVIERIIKR